MDSRLSPAPTASRQKTPTSSSTLSQQAPSNQTRPGSASSLKSTIASSSGMHRASSKALADDGKGRSASKDSLKPRSSSISNETAKQNEEALKTLRSEFDNLRALVTCKICCRLLYEPYTVSCGHTYCYSCLSQWFVNNKAKKTCPDCRAVVNQMPAPAYLIREMTLAFIKRAELLPTGETIQEHTKWQKEESNIVLQDKNNKHPKIGGLFKGCFRAIILQPRRDEEDGVDRCPVCFWELEDGGCHNCGLQFDDDGSLTWGNSFGGFSDIDESSEHDMSEDPDGEIDMEDDDAELGFDNYGGDPSEWMDQEMDDPVQRWIHGMPRFARHYHLGPIHRRPAAHSAAGSLRYSASLAEDTEMGTLEEEDEEELEDEDSSMNDFIDDEVETESVATSTEATLSVDAPVQTNTRRQQRNRRIIPSETSSNVSQATGEDEDEEGPIPNGRRRQQQLQARILRRANGSQQSRQPPSSVSTDTSGDGEELDEETQRLLSAQGWSPLNQDGTEDDMGDEEYESDGGRTEVGWEPTANPNFRSRTGGSLTPTADRPNAPIRPPSRVGISRVGDNPRNVRRRGSVISASTVSYEDGEADDDDSDIDRDGDTSMNGNTLRTRTSRVRLRDQGAQGINRSVSRGLPQGETTEGEDDDDSDTFTRRRRGHEYFPRISWMFAQHQRNLAQLHQLPGADAFFDHLDQLRTITPISRPRTANRNRSLAQGADSQPQSPAGMNPPQGIMNSPVRLRTPVIGGSSNGISSPTARAMRSERSSISSNPSVLSDGTSTNGGVNLNREFPAGIPGNLGSMPPRPGSHSRTSSQGSIDAIAQASAGSPIDLMDRPISRISARPPSAQGRRGSAGYIAAFQSPPVSLGVGLNYAQRALQAQPTNPWRNHIIAHFPPTYIRPRQSSARLRERDSTQTLRPSNSRQTLRPQPSVTNVRDPSNQSQNVRPQASRNNLRTRASQHRLSQPSSRGMRDLYNGTQPPLSPTSVPIVRSSVPAGQRLSEDERQRLSHELLQNRARNLGINPFASRRVGASQNNNSTASLDSQHSGGQPSNSSRPSAIADSTTPSQARPTPSSSSSALPTNSGRHITRQRSRQTINAPSGVVPPQPVSPTGQSGSYRNNIPQARSGQTPGSPRFDTHINVGATRGLSPMVAAGDSGRY